MNNFKIITTVYNGEKYIEKCIDSVLSQTYKNWKMRIIDDNSTDNTLGIIIRKTLNDDKFVIQNNQENKKALKNYVETIPLICDKDEDIIVSLDGDDWLASNDVLEYLNTIYEDKKILMTYGQYQTLSDNKKGLIGPIISDIRKESCQLGKNFSHLKTWKKKLFDKIKEEDLKRPDGKYIQGAWDTALQLSALNNCELENIKFIDKVLYIYNNMNPISEWRKKTEYIDGIHFQEWEDKYIRDMWRKKWKI